MNNKTKIGLVVLALGISFGVGRFSKPTKVETKEVVKTVVQKEEAKTKIVYKDRIVYPDGTIKETETSKETTDTKEKAVAEQSKQTEVKNDSGLTLQALAIVNINDITGNREYGLYAKKRVIGNISVGAMITTDKKVALGIGLDF